MARNVLVDKLKGYACFLVLFGHVIMGIRLAGVNIPQFFWGMEKFIWSFHVALFLFLSGVVYQMTGEWKSKQTKWGFVLHKLYTLGIPYVAFSAIYVLINSFVGDANSGFELTDILTIWKTPIAQYWFLYALFFLFCIFTSCSGFLKKWQITLFCVLIGYLVPLFGGSFGSFDVVIYAALAFGVGTFIDFQKIFNIPNWAKWIVIATHIIVAVLLIVFQKIEALFLKDLMLLFGIYASVLLISMLQQSQAISRFLSFINRYSFQIYLLHTIFTAGVRIILIRLQITQWWIHIVVGTVCGIAFSVLAAKIAEKVRFLNFFFFPAKAWPIKKGGTNNAGCR